MAIKVSNVYYMLAYAFQGMSMRDALNLGSEEFENLHSLFTELLLRGMNRQIKRGIHRDYAAHTETLSGVRGKINLTDSINGMSHISRQLVCEYDEFTEDTFPNRVIKAAIMVLLRHGDISTERRRGLKRLMAYLSEVAEIRPIEIRFDLLKTQRVNAEYKFLLLICRLLFEFMFMTEENGERRLRAFLPDDKVMPKLYEKFLCGYYKYHHPEFHAGKRQIKWDLTDIPDGDFLPKMETDITLSLGSKTLIIDTKWYGKTMAAYWRESPYQSGKHKYHSGNMYQIYSYVNNAAKGVVGNVSGALLYAKTDEGVTPDNEYSISGNDISVKTLDLSVDFAGISAQLENIAQTLMKQW
ncbi:5-methylcytosine-specific restriction system specificity protein McrC [Clostridia bacterium]|nr:5-methylcytosine-specific restriction system specificity protein McrC [Clostridia bacterium]